VTYAEALRRIAQLNRAGLWPGIITGHVAAYKDGA
jgi:hypothetical protein